VSGFCYIGSRDKLCFWSLVINAGCYLSLSDVYIDCLVTAKFDWRLSKEG